jgi:aspartate kinase
VLRKVAERVGSPEVSVDTNVAKVSIIGSGIASSPGVAGRMFQALAREGINIELISSSEVRIVCVIARDRLPDAVRAIHREFDLANLERKRVADPA